MSEQLPLNQGEVDSGAGREGQSSGAISTPHIPVKDLIAVVNAWKRTSSSSRRAFTLRENELIRIGLEALKSCPAVSEGDVVLSEIHQLGPPELSREDILGAVVDICEQPASLSEIDITMAALKYLANPDALAKVDLIVVGLYALIFPEAPSEAAVLYALAHPIPRQISHIEDQTVIGDQAAIERDGNQN